MAEELPRPIIVKKIKKGGHGHHGGAWKIAYADFVTAMMAFFLLMWLLGSTSPEQKAGISEYFQTPLKQVLMGPSMGGATTPLKGGGRDFTKTEGQVKPISSTKGNEKTVDIEQAKDLLKKAEKKRLEDLKSKITKAIETNPTLKQFKSQLLLDITTEVLRVQIVDDQNRPMFNTAKAVLQPYAKVILREIGAMLNDVPNKISLSGHTDAAGYASGGTAYSNWELSADRANASRRELIAGGMNEEKLMRVVGLASASLFDKENPFNPVNRRISLIIMNKEAEESAMRDQQSVKVSSDASSDEIDAVLPNEKVDAVSEEDFSE
jgi:chemotaxis protein MotB